MYISSALASSLKLQLGEDYSSALILLDTIEIKLTPPVATLGVPLLESLLDGLLGILTLTGLLEGVVGNGSLEGLELENVSGGEEMGVVDNLDERLDLGSSRHLLLSHRLGDLQGVPVC